MKSFNNRKIEKTKEIRLQIIMSIDRNHRHVYCNQTDGVTAGFLSDKIVLAYLILFRVGYTMSM